MFTNMGNALINKQNCTVHYSDRQSENARYWLGAEKRGTEFVWYNGRHLAPGLTWDAGEPNNFHGSFTGSLMCSSL